MDRSIKARPAKCPEMPIILNFTRKMFHRDWGTKDTDKSDKYSFQNSKVNYRNINFLHQSPHPASSIKPFQAINIFETIYKFKDLFRAKVRYQNIIPVEIPCLVQLQGNQDRRDLSRVFLDSPN